MGESLAGSRAGRHAVEADAGPGGPAYHAFASGDVLGDGGHPGGPGRLGSQRLDSVDDRCRSDCSVAAVCARLVETKETLCGVSRTLA